jgi:uncharacterized protein
MISRIIKDRIVQDLNTKHKIIVIYGPRQVGKTTLLKSLQKDYDGKSLWINADILTYHDVLSSRDINQLKNLVDNNRLLIIDEAQRISNIGINLKILFEEIEGINIIVTGSSSLELANATKETLTGRTITYHLYPIALSELRHSMSRFDIENNLEDYMLYGLYPEVLTLSGPSDKQNHLLQLTSSYLYRDVLELSNIRYSDKIHKLLQLLAYQVGSLVSTQELANTLQLNHETVNSYINLLEQGFIIQRLSGLSNNPRKEISKMDKFYFYDVGIRNALIQDFRPLTLRNDVGMIWENFVVMERIKYLSYNNIYGKNYFWRRYSGAEIDWVEQRDDQYHAFEIKWNKNARKTSIPKSWQEDYPNHVFNVLNRDTFFDWAL